ncbi:glucose-6-phosphate isomerase [Sphingomonas astaxanthinifaciens]|uniref:Glucose-6-phosphate isomerase n=1 Tax=Sphingomonas astaxanthinifaciens DSM 22298 TaxID=1123267 RepID=A0ABQ5ZC86_9SPHN|nr:glucose-6-phosphate isomerase [Sphingomonas astaxanthinifaciens]GLR48399.1 glucose-6-phosphate isomerase [Sphingomonas astaxanthinifaciens DSM 22298]
MTSLSFLADAPPAPLQKLFEEDPERATRFAHDLGGIRFDFSKTHLTADLLDRVDAAAYAAALERLVAGEVINPTEGRAAEHLAERGTGSPDAVALAAQRHSRMRALIDAIEAGAFGDITGVLHIGIGGSALGPALLVDALGRTERRYKVEILSNIDGQAVDSALARLDPATTLVAIASKTFTTAETLRNADAALAWLEEAGVEDPYGRLVAITAAPEKAVEFGIDETRVLPFAPSVGGRYSLWSSIGFPAALALGMDAFEQLLEGAALVDEHVAEVAPTANIPLIAAVGDLLYSRGLGAETRAVFAYDDRLRLLPSYLQQLVMESNGKSATLDGKAVDGATSAILWGGTGTDAQHAVFQLLHQGTHLVPVEFVAVAEGNDEQEPTHHRELLLNMLAQGAALMAGRDSGDLHRNYPGNRPSTTILLDDLDPAALGTLIAFYEHRTFAEAVLLGINPFDQFGVELGKEMARAIDDPEARAAFDPSTRALIERAGL